MSILTGNNPFYNKAVFNEWNEIKKMLSILMKKMVAKRKTLS
jgi:hypothetical protein